MTQSPLGVGYASEPRPRERPHTIGHTRVFLQATSEAKRQVRYAAKQGLPSILLIYNNLDPLFLFGTEEHDFIAAVYGEYTLTIDREAEWIPVPSDFSLNVVQGKGYDSEDGTTGKALWGAVTDRLAARLRRTLTLAQRLSQRSRVSATANPWSFDRDWAKADSE